MIYHNCNKILLLGKMLTKSINTILEVIKKLNDANNRNIINILEKCNRIQSKNKVYKHYKTKY